MLKERFRRQPRGAVSVRVLFLGQSCDAAAPPLRAMLDAGHDVVAAVLAGRPGTETGEPERLAAEAGIPVVWVASSRDATAAIGAAAPEAAAAACFPWRLGREARRIPPLGILNVHPSLLPAGRGPEPVFWTLRRGEQVTGATVHLMDAGLDTGPIVAQATRPVPSGVRAPELQRNLMSLGGRLLVESLPALATGALTPSPQPVEGVSHAPMPGPAD
jgi:methionyl-tRNA formyltransferase